jgi:hypothetical protein
MQSLAEVCRLSDASEAPETLACYLSIAHHRVSRNEEAASCPLDQRCRTSKARRIPHGGVVNDDGSGM